jgi:hypothetical protein
VRLERKTPTKKSDREKQKQKKLPSKPENRTKIINPTKQATKEKPPLKTPLNFLL